MISIFFISKPIRIYFYYKNW